MAFLPRTLVIVKGIWAEVNLAKVIISGNGFLSILEEDDFWYRDGRVVASLSSTV
jgi:hypothetical protein